MPKIMFDNSASRPAPAGVQKTKIETPMTTKKPQWCGQNTKTKTNGNDYLWIYVLVLSTIGTLTMAIKFIGFDVGGPFGMGVSPLDLLLTVLNSPATVMKNCPLIIAPMLSSISFFVIFITAIRKKEDLFDDAITFEGLSLTSVALSAVSLYVATAYLKNVLGGFGMSISIGAILMAACSAGLVVIMIAKYYPHCIPQNNTKKTEKHDFFRYE